MSRTENLLLWRIEHCISRTPYLWYTWRVSEAVHFCCTATSTERRVKNV